MTNLTKAEELKLQFDQLASYEDRINFCLENLHPGPCLNTAPGVAAYLFHNEENEDVRSCTSSSLPFHPEALNNWSIIISTMPQTPEEWQLNNKLFYEYLESAWFTSEGANQIDKSFLQRKQEFEKRIVNTVDSEEILKEEIQTVFNTYEQPSIKIDESNIHFNLQVKRFRERRRGHLSQFPTKQDKWFEDFISLCKIIEADHAYQYYKYLRGLAQNPKWLQDLQTKLRAETRLMLDKNFGESYDSQYFNREIKEHGYVTIGTPNKVYSGPLAAFLFAQAINVKEQYTQIPKTIRGRDYLDSYRIGYERGSIWFKENYSLTTDTLYGPNAKAYIANIHDLCFHLNCGTWPLGLLSWKGKYPLLIADRIIEEHGYYAGIIAQVEELTAKHSRLFENWAECHYDDQAETSQPTQQLDSLQYYTPDTSISANAQTTQPQFLSNESDQKITEWVYSLRQKFYVATRWQFKHNEEGKRDLIATFDLINIQNEFDKFKAALKIQLMNTQNWKAIEIDLQNELLIGILQYYDWYNNSVEYRDFFGQDSPYDIILNISQSTEREIVKYFPDLIHQLIQNKYFKAQESSTSNSPKQLRQPRASTLVREKRLRDLVENYMKVEGKHRPEAMKLAADKEGCGLDTVERALGLKKGSLRQVAFCPSASCLLPLKTCFFAEKCFFLCG